LIFVTARAASEILVMCPETPAAINKRVQNVHHEIPGTSWALIHYPSLRL